MTVNVTLLNSSDKLIKHSGLFEEVIEGGLTRVSEFFELSAIDITVSLFKKGKFGTPIIL